LAPVVAAVVARALFGGDPIFVLHDYLDPDAGHYHQSLVYERYK
jgi:hypothetical protein